MGREKFKVEKGVFDGFTIRNLKKLETQGFFDHTELSPLFLGKEAHVFTGEGKNGIVAVKVYRLENCDFNQMYSYIKHDTRIKGVKRNKRDVILMWVKREYRNLLKARESGVRVPTPYIVNNNIIVMELIGEPAPKVKDLIPSNVKKFYDDCIVQISKMLKAGLVHADLSQFNILNNDEKPVFIDLSQSTTIQSVRAKEYFDRDLRNLNNFFLKIGLKEKELKKPEDFIIEWKRHTR